MTTATQLPLPIEGLERRLTIAMEAGTQIVRQCASCGTVVIVPSSNGQRGPDLTGKACPACDRLDGWWREYVGPGHDLCGFRLEGASA